VERSQPGNGEAFAAAIAADRPEQTVALPASLHREYRQWCEPPGHAQLR
jgi:hypothetical protein